jgi:alcohol dehydrogenase (cytochrome c)
MANDPYDFDEISEHPIIDAKVNGEDRKLVVHAARNGFFYVLDRTNGSFIVGKQYVDTLNWTPGLDPKTGKPLNCDPNVDVQIYAPGTHGTRARPFGDRLCPSVSGGKNWQPSAYNPQLGHCRGTGIAPSHKSTWSRLLRCTRDGRDGSCMDGARGARGI